jgi:hypothetical protein
MPPETTTTIPEASHAQTRAGIKFRRSIGIFQKLPLLIKPREAKYRGGVQPSDMILGLQPYETAFQSTWPTTRILLSTTSAALQRSLESPGKKLL